jgi:protein required for attachment to host cells
MKPIRTLVLVAGETSARFFLNEGVSKGVTQIADLSAFQFEGADTAYSDRPGRSTGGPGGAARHGLERHESVDEQRRSRFSAHVIKALEQEWRRAGPDRLILAAPPKMLGVLRAGLSGAMAAALIADLPKDLLKVATRDLPEHFSDVMAM